MRTGVFKSWFNKESDRFSDQMDAKSVEDKLKKQESVTIESLTKKVGKQPLLYDLRTSKRCQ